jgi:hypothetical protein
MARQRFCIPVHDVVGCDTCNVETLSTNGQRAIGVGGGLIIVVLVYASAGFGDIERVWAAAATLLLGLMLGEVLTNLRSQIGTPGAVPGALLAVLLAMYLCVPETDQFVVAALIPLALLTLELVRREQFGIEWYAVAAFSVAWAGMFGASGRQSALVGALFAWWPILLPWMISRLTGVRSRRSVIVSMTMGAVAALLFARTGGISDSGVTAALVVVALAAVSVGGGWLIARRLAPRPTR